jgi:putative aldouronate transport system substrate-binding protein
MSSKLNRISRRRFLSLAGVTTAAGVVAACGGSAPAPTAAPAATKAPEAAKATEAPKAAEPTAAPSGGQMVTLKYVYTNFVGVPADQQLISDALNKITQDRINARMDLMNLEYGSFNDKVQLMSAGGEQYDLVYTANWVNDYYKNVDNGQFVELDDLLPNLAPGLWKSLPVTTWQAAKVNGKLYASINQQQFPKNGGFYVKKDIAEKYKLDVNTINKWEDLEPYLEQIKAGENITPFVSSSGLRQAEICGYGPVDDAISFVWVKGDDKTGSLVNWFEAPRHKELWDLHRRWWEKGYIPKEDPKLDEESGLLKSGKAVFKWEPVVKPKFESEFVARTGWDLNLRQLAPNILTTSGITATLTGLSRTTVSKETAVKWLELVNTDKPTYNLLCMGIEGKHWNWKNKEKEVIEQIKDAPYNPTTDWMFGNQFMAYYRAEASIGAWEGGKKINDTATPLATLGFVMNREPVKNEIAAVNTTMTGYVPTGPKGIPSSDLGKAVTDMNAAGAKKVMDEMQKQIQEWMKAK